MTTRERLPNRRPAETFEIEIEGIRYAATIGRFANGRLAEIFLSSHKNGTAADTAARESAVVCSLALQHGAEPETVRHALPRDANGRDGGPLATVLDLVSGQDSRGRK
jgi:hypothetical protein